MSNTILNNVASYLTNLSATNEICTALGSTIVGNTNLFMYTEPSADVDAITLIPYGGVQPNKDGFRQESVIQIRMKSSSKQTLISTQQAIINTLHMNTLNGNGLMISNTSIPIIVGELEGGQYTVSTTNFRIKHIKV